MRRMNSHKHEGLKLYGLFIKVDLLAAEIVKLHPEQLKVLLQVSHHDVYHRDVHHSYALLQKLRRSRLTLTRELMVLSSIVTKNALKLRYTTPRETVT